MSRALSEYPTDSNIQLVIDDLRLLREKLWPPPDEAASVQLTNVVAAYLTVNRELLDQAFDAWEATSEEELRRMCAEARPLDGAATLHAFSEIARHLIPLAPDMLRNGRANLIRVDEDDLHMMLRVLEYARYLAECSSATVQWHPIGQLLARPIEQIEEEVEDLRAELLAS